MKLLVVTLVAVALSGQVASAEKPAGETWHSNLDSAWKESRSSDQPILLFVTMDGCSYCTKMARTTFADAGVKADMKDGYVAASVNGSKNPQVARKLRIQFYPATFLVAPDSRVLDRIDGYVSATELRQRLAKATKALHDAPARQAKLPTE